MVDLDASAARSGATLNCEAVKNGRWTLSGGKRHGRPILMPVDDSDLRPLLACYTNRLAVKVDVLEICPGRHLYRVSIRSSVNRRLDSGEVGRNADNRGFS